MTDSILDKVLDSQKNAAATEFNPQQILKELFSDLNEREQEVLNLRYGLDDNKKRTLEEIGKKFEVTRERIRQIENSALKKIRKNKNLDDKIKPLENILSQVLEDHGGVLHEDDLIKKAVPSANNKSARTAIEFILSKFLKDKFHFIKGDSHLENSWKLPTVSLDQVKLNLEEILNIIDKKGKPVAIEFIVSEIDKEHINESVAEALLTASKFVSTNPFDEWGRKEWDSISLKRTSDKIYLILSKTKKPLHFTDIAKKIDELSFDNKKANPATIHNELILDKKYVLVGRGIYALNEWGYKPGVVSDVIEDILKKNDTPLSREEIIEKVLENRLVKRSTIILALMDKSKFKKESNGYVLNS